MGLPFSLVHTGMWRGLGVFLDIEISILDAEISEFLMWEWTPEAAKPQEDE